MKKIRRIIAALLLSVLVIAYASSAYALSTNYGIFYLSGGSYISGATIGGSFTVKNTEGVSDSLSCSITGNGFNGANAMVGTYSGYKNVTNSQTCKAEGSGSCYVVAAYVVTYYTFKGITWAE